MTRKHFLSTLYRYFSKGLHLALLLCLPFAIVSCRYIGTIDDDTSNCNHTYRFTYHMHAVSNTNDQITTQLSNDGDAALRQDLTSLLTPLLHPNQYGANLLFQDMGERSNLVSPQTFIGDETSLTMMLCPNDYRHVAVTGTDKDIAMLRDSMEITKAAISQPQKDTISSQQVALLSGRKEIKITGNEDNIHVHLFPANAAIAVVAKQDATVKDVKIFFTDLASSFTLNDSTYHFDQNAFVRTTLNTTANQAKKIYYALVFPSRDNAPGTIDKDNTQASGAFWRTIIMAEIADGTTTRTVLYVKKALHAGDVKIINITVGSNGAAESTDTNMGASVTLDWKNGGSYDPNI